MIILTGSSGQVGSELKAQLKLNKLPYKAFDKISLDITSKKSIKTNLDKINNLKVIINLAAYTNVEECEKKLSPNKKVNFIGVKNLCNYIKNKKILLIQISTDYVFNGLKNKAYTERDKTNPLNEYGIAKENAELYIKRKLSMYIILRSSWIFSKKKSSFFKFIDKNYKKNIYLIDDIYGCPTSSRSLSNGIIFIINKLNQNKKIKYGIYHFCNYPHTNWFNFGKFYMKFKKYNLSKLNNIKAEKLNLKAKRPLNSILNSRKFETEFNFKKIYWKSEIKNFF